MNRIRQWGTVAVVGTALGAGTLLNPLPSRAADELTLTATVQTSLLAIPCGDCVVDSQPRGAHIGGTEYDAGVLSDHGRTVGKYVIEETGMTPFTEDADGRVQLVGTLSIGQSQVTFQGVEDPPLDSGAVAITGGTGRFAGARGEITYSDASDTVTRLHVHFE